jgi:hypothetical protein
MLDETILQTYLDRGEFIYAKNSWLGGKNVERAERLGITPKKRAYVRRNAPWSKARRYKEAMSKAQKARIASFKLAVADAKRILGIKDPVEAVRLVFGEAKPREYISRAKATEQLIKEAMEILETLPKEVRELVEKERAAWIARLERIKAERAAG